MEPPQDQVEEDALVSTIDEPSIPISPISTAIESHSNSTTPENPQKLKIILRLPKKSLEDSSKQTSPTSAVPKKATKRKVQLPADEAQTHANGTSATPTTSKKKGKATTTPIDGTHRKHKSTTPSTPDSNGFTPPQPAPKRKQPLNVVVIDADDTAEPKIKKPKKTKSNKPKKSEYSGLDEETHYSLLEELELDEDMATIEDEVKRLQELKATLSKEHARFLSALGLPPAKPTIATKPPPKRDFSFASLLNPVEPAVDNSPSTSFVFSAEPPSDRILFHTPKPPLSRSLPLYPSSPQQQHSPQSRSHSPLHSSPVFSPSFSPSPQQHYPPNFVYAPPLSPSLPPIHTTPHRPVHRSPNNYNHNHNHGHGHSHNYTIPAPLTPTTPTTPTTPNFTNFQITDMSNAYNNNSNTSPSPRKPKATSSHTKVKRKEPRTPTRMRLREHPTPKHFPNDILVMNPSSSGTKDGGGDDDDSEEAEVDVVGDGFD